MIELNWLDPGSTDFPNTSQALSEPDGLLAAGGDLSAETLITAYQLGIFPWFDDSQPILWWSPNPRSVVIPGQEHISRSLAKTIRQQHFDIRFDTEFLAVIESCALPRNYTDETWISSEMVEAYNELHHQGIAHSVECWKDNQLVGGLYGLAIGGVFFGESMFSQHKDASKVAFATLCKRLGEAGFGLIDCQVANTHLTSLGATDMERSKFEHLLQQHLAAKPTKNPFV